MARRLGGIAAAGGGRDADRDRAPFRPRRVDSVATVSPDSTVRDLLDTLAEHRIGAVVVDGRATAIAGIVSERDVVRHLRAIGARHPRPAGGARS